MADRVTKEQAEAVREALISFYSDYYEEGYGPKIRDDFDWTETIPDWAVTWEEGPEEWVYEFTYAANSGELAGIPKGVFIESATSWAVSLYIEPHTD